MADQPLSSLELLRPELDAIPSADVRTPNVRVAVYHQDTNDLKTLVARDDIRARLLAVGLEQSTLTALPVALDASRSAQSAWVVSTDRSKPTAQRDREQRGYEHRSEMIAACRWNLRANRAVQAALDVISEGDGIPDLIQDLRDIGALTEANLPAFARDETFDAKEAVETARSLADEIAAGQSSFTTDEGSTKAKDLRDRAWTHLWNLDSEIRAAARHAYRNDQEQLARFVRPTHATPKRKKQEAGDQPVTTPVAEA
jgi:hypothetical protein